MFRSVIWVRLCMVAASLKVRGTESLLPNPRGIAYKD